MSARRGGLPNCPEGCLPRGGVCLVCPGWCLARGVCLVCRGGGLPSLSGRHPLVDRILDTLLSKHYLSITTFADGNKGTTQWLKIYFLVSAIVPRCELLNGLIFHEQDYCEIKRLIKTKIATLFSLIQILATISSLFTPLHYFLRKARIS